MLHFIQMHSCRLQKLMITGCKVNGILKMPTNFALVQTNKKVFCEENSSQLMHILQQRGDPWHHHLGPHHCVQAAGVVISLLLLQMCRMEQKVTTTRVKVWLTSRYLTKMNANMFSSFQRSAQ